MVPRWQIALMLALLTVLLGLAIVTVVRLW
jgi:hypothetical protein